jgi:hypothetical protein
LRWKWLLAFSTHTPPAPKPRFVQFFENLYAAVNSLHTCQFTAYAYVLEPPIVKYTPKLLLGLTMQYLPADCHHAHGHQYLFQTLAVGDRVASESMANAQIAGARIHVLERYHEYRRRHFAQRRYPATAFFGRGARMRCQKADGSAATHAGCLLPASWI